MAESLNDLLKKMESSRQPSEIFPILLLMLSAKQGKNYDVLANLSAILDNKTLIRMLQLFEGCTITFPSVNDYRIMMLTLMIVYEQNILGQESSSLWNNLSTVEHRQVSDMYKRSLKEPKFRKVIEELIQNEENDNE